MEKNQNSLPIMLFDGNCDFCRSWIGKWKRITGKQVLYAPYQEALPKYAHVTAQQCAKSVHLILPDGTVHAGAHAVFKALDLSGRCPILLHLYERSPLCAHLSEWLYQIVAGHRPLFSKFG
jgi:predicted DCC family thiol-disulfide oxidoreductase YuxK